MLPLSVSHIFVEHIPGRPSNARVYFEGGIRLDGLKVWPARHGPLVLFPLGTEGNSNLHLTPLLRTLVVQAVVSAWRRSKIAQARIAA